jgi:hypothetical protein
MSLSARILSELEAGQWTLTSIAPSFRRRLTAETKSQLQEKNISELCMGFYGNVRPHDIVIPNQRKELDVARISNEVQGLIERTFASDYSGAAVISFESEISQKLQTALELIHRTDAGISLLLSELVAAFVRVKSVNFQKCVAPANFWADFNW